MEHVLESFCRESGQLMNRRKSVLWFSPNKPSYLKNFISSTLGMVLTSSLGSYLGVPLIHGQLRQTLYSSLLDRVRRKLATWKIKTLSRAACTVLIQSTLLAILVYLMQSALLPCSIIREVERLCRQFFWGEIGVTRKLHTIKWDTLCQPRRHGGLGLLSLRPTNLVLLAKAGWRILSLPTSLSAQIFIEKYGQWEDIRNCHCVVSASSTWRGIFKTLDLLRLGIRWRLGTGTRIGFWMDRWLLDELLQDLALVPLTVDELRSSMCAYWSDNLGWQLEVLRPKLPTHIISLLLPLVLDHSGDRPDFPQWRLSASGQFSTSSARRLLQLTPPACPDRL